MNSTILSKLKKASSIYDKYSLDNVYLAGSYARWEEKEESDIDLYIQTKRFLDLYEYMNLKFELEAELWKQVDIIMDDNLKEWVKKYILQDLVLI